MTETQNEARRFLYADEMVQGCDIPPIFGDSNKRKKIGVCQMINKSILEGPPRLKPIPL